VVARTASAKARRSCRDGLDGALTTVEFDRLGADCGRLRADRARRDPLCPRDTWHDDKGTRRAGEPGRPSLVVPFRDGGLIRHLAAIVLIDFDTRTGTARSSSSSRGQDGQRLDE